MLSQSFIQAAARLSFAMAGDLRETVDYVQVSAPILNPSTGKSVATRNTIAGIQVLVPDIDETELDPSWGVNSRTDSKLMILAEDLDGAIPDSTDEVVRTGGVTWRVIKVCRPVGNAIHVIYVREG